MASASLTGSDEKSLPPRQHARVVRARCARAPPPLVSSNSVARQAAFVLVPGNSTARWCKAGAGEGHTPERWSGDAALLVLVVGAGG